MNKNKGKKGLTIIELLIFVGLAAIVFIYFFGIFKDFYLARNRSNRMEEVYNSITISLNNIIQDSRWSVSCDTSYSDRLVLESSDPVVGDVIYELDSGVFKRNNIPITDEEIEVLDFSVEKRGGLDDTPLLIINLAIEHKDKNPRVFLQESMVISLREDDVKVIL